MRAGPLSDPRVRKILNSQYVPIYVSNEDYRDPQITSEAERARYEKVFQSATEKQLSRGTVHVYILAPNGELSTSKHVAEATRTDELIKLLREQLRKFPTEPGETLVKPKPQFVPPRPEPGAMLLHSVARVRPGENFWAGIAEDWISVPRENWTQLRAPSNASVGTTWKLSDELAQQLFTYVYPPTGNFILESHAFHVSTLEARLVSITDGEYLVALDGKLNMDHDFLHPDEYKVDAVIVGYVRYRQEDTGPPELRMSTFSATYATGRFDHIMYSIANDVPRK